MTTINNQEDFLRALTDNPQWKEAVRAQILGEELLQLPVRFNALMERMTLFIAEMSAFVSDQKQFNAEQREFNAKTDDHFARIDRRFDTLSNDVAQVKGGHARAVAVDNAAVIALDMGFEYVRFLSRLEMALMAQRAKGGDIPANELESFRNADLIIEAKNGSQTHYITVEASFTSDHRDTDRAQRNARFLTRFTGCPAHAAVASVRNDHAVEAQITSGIIHWHHIPLRDLDPE